MPAIVWHLCTGIDAVTMEWLESDVAAEQRDLARQLRINLLRHHAEREVLAHTLDCVLVPGRLVTQGPSLGSAALCDYLVRSAARLTRGQRFGLEQVPIAQALVDAETAAFAVDHSGEGRYREL